MRFSIDCLEITASRGIVEANGNIYKNLLTAEDFDKYRLPKRFFFNDFHEKEFGESGNLVLKKEKKSCPNSFYGENINIQAIVGKNGAGKSSVLDLMYMVINNFSYMFERGKYRPGAADLYYVRYLYLNLYFSIDNNSHTLRCSDKKICLDNLEFEIDENHEGYVNKDPKYKGISDVDLPEKLKNFFYTIVSNYSLQSFISSNYDCDAYVREKNGVNQWDQECKCNWIDPIFHKNDGYKRSIVLNPYRNFGIINMETELELSKDRFIALIIKDKEIDGDYSLEQISYNVSNRKVDDLRRFFSASIAKRIPIPQKTKTLDEKLVEIVKSIDVGDDVFEEYLNNYLHNDNRFNFLTDFFHFGILQESPTEKKLCLLYLYKKICQIVLKYPEYAEYKAFSPFDKDGKFKEPSVELPENQKKVLLDKIANGKSHIEIKAKRAINFLGLTDENIRILLANSKFDSSAFLKIFEENPDEKDLDWIIEHLPPSFFEKKIVLKNKKKNVFVDYKKLSSGEHQKYQNISTHLYHIMNLISVQKENERNQEKRLAYKYVNLVFDEIEICFHPEYQRTFVNTLVQMLIARKINEKCVINIFLVTHSPFILSDIPSSNVLFLKEGEQDYSEKDRRTFAENIGEMFYDSFFMEYTIGAFAEWKLKELVKRKQGKESKIANEEEAKYILDCIGDPVIKSLIDEVEPSINV